MRVRLKFFAGLRELLPPGEGPHLAEFAEGTTVGQALAAYGVPADKPRIVLVNGIHAEDGRVLAEGDTLSVFPPIAGG